MYIFIKDFNNSPTGPILSKIHRGEIGSSAIRVSGNRTTPSVGEQCDKWYQRTGMDRGSVLE